ncbi:hypothetical protein D3C78_1570810 [compost metagenome]
MELARWYLLQCCRVEHIVHTAHCLLDAARVAHITDVELELGAVVALAHVVLLFLVATEDADFSDICVEKALEDGVAERAGASSNKKGSSHEYIGFHYQFRLIKS